ncbi:MAG: PHP domain-containing protein [Nitrospinae bacterium]|nr:PHP domain-containing protein [Nitrospinota bacterium]
MKLKLDLHTHCLEAVNFARPEPKTVRRILEAVQAAGLDGIAITDHAEIGDGFAYAAREVVERHFPGEILVIPGRELRWRTHHLVELDLPEGLTFRFLAHPGRDLSAWDGCVERIREPSGVAGFQAAPILPNSPPHPGFPDSPREKLHGLEIENGNQTIDRARVLAFAQRHGLLLLSNSDAHSLSDIGNHYTETSLEELCAYI